MKENINEHDMTKKMMDIIRNGKKVITEAEAPMAPAPEPVQAPNNVAPLVPGDDLPEPEENTNNQPKETDGDTLTAVAGDAVFNEELQKLRDTVDNSAQITNFKIYPIDRNVVIDGVIEQREGANSGIHFTMNRLSGEIQTSMEGIELDDDVNEVLHHLQGYYKIWRQDWNDKIDEYKSKN